MKLNLPSTLTNKKMTSLLLMTWLSVNGVNGGKAFRNCLVYDKNDSTSYDLLLKYPFNFKVSIENIGITPIEHPCCSKTKCSSLGCPSDFIEMFSCYELSQGVYCRATFSCGGMIGDAPITENLSITLSGSCPKDVTETANYISSITPIGINNGYAYWGCPGGTLCTESDCNWDNGGWTCVPWAAANNCLLQWTAPWPGSADKNPFPMAPTSTSVISTSAMATSNKETPTFTSSASVITVTNNSSPTIIPPQGTYPIEKIIIPAVGSVIGVITIGGITYYVIRKRRNKHNVLLVAGNRNRESEVTNNQNQEVREFVELTPQNRELSHLSVQNLSFQNKQSQLGQLIQYTKNKIDSNLIVSLETLLDTQAEIVKGNNTFAIRQLQREAEEKLLTKLTLEEIGRICWLQSEVVRLQLQQEQELQAQIEVNPYGQELRSLGRE